MNTIARHRKCVKATWSLIGQASFSLIIVILAFSSCSARHPGGSQNKPESGMGIATPQASANRAAPDFYVSNAWKPKVVEIKTLSDTVPGFNYKLTLKPGHEFIVLELTLKPARQGEPTGAKTILIDSTNERHNPLFSYPSSLSRYQPNGNSVSFVNDHSKSGRKLSELGGKLISVFQVPANRGNFKVEIDSSDPLDVELTGKQ